MSIDAPRDTWLRMQGQEPRSALHPCKREIEVLLDRLVQALCQRGEHRLFREVIAVIVSQVDREGWSTALPDWTIRLADGWSEETTAIAARRFAPYIHD